MSITFITQYEVNTRLHIDSLPRKKKKAYKKMLERIKEIEWSEEPIDGSYVYSVDLSKFKDKPF